MKSELMTLAMGFDSAGICRITPEASAYGLGKVPFSSLHLAPVLLS